jgi:hypothetical protein
MKAAEKRDLANIEKALGSEKRRKINKISMLTFADRSTYFLSRYEIACIEFTCSSSWGLVQNKIWVKEQNMYYKLSIFRQAVSELP